MTGRVQELDNILEPDRKAVEITNLWLNWDGLRSQKKQDWEEIRRYVYATDTTQTTNSSLPWKNRTVIPKLCQIRDNLYANYSATLFPQRESIIWEANEKDAASRDKRDAITNYMGWVIDQPTFKHELDKIILDYIDFGNCFATVEWVDERVEHANKIQSGYVGPALRRISPLDIVMNPVAENFNRSPKIVRSLINRGELKKILDSMSNDENREEYEELWKYLKGIRQQADTYEGDWSQRDTLYQMDGFGNFRDYLRSGQVEVLTFYGDLYDPDTDTFLENHVLTVVDRHKLIGCKPNPSFFGFPPIFHAAWRKKQDNLWGMGPLDNLVGMQYRIDHIENMKADIFDLVTYPVVKVKGFVEPFVWQPGEHIYLNDDADVDMLTPDVNVLQANFEIQNIERLMEEMAGAPREAMGFRTPGEKTKYEFQQLENAAARVFQNKIRQFEEFMVEVALNALLELGRRNFTGTVTIVFDDEFKNRTFEMLTVEDILGAGRIKPVAARHFAEQAQLVQNFTNLSNSPLWATMQPHVSGVKLTELFINDLFNAKNLGLVMPYIGLTEQADAQRHVQQLQQMLAQEATTATGLGEDFDIVPPVVQPPIEEAPQ